MSARLDGCQNLQHLVGTGKSATGSERIGFRADEEQVEQRFLCADGTSEGSCDRNSLFEHVRPGMVAERIKDQRVPDKEFIFEFSDDGLSGLGPTAPMYVAQWIAVPVIPQSHEFVALADIRGECNAARLIFHRAGQSNRRKRIAFGQDERGLGRWDGCECAE